MILPVISYIFIAPHSFAQTDNWQVEGENGVIHVFGALTESACRLDMKSAYQSIDVGNIGTGELLNIGDQGIPVEVQLNLRDCLRTTSDNRDERSGNLRWSASQPAVSVSFIAHQDFFNSALIEAKGVSGLGLRLSDVNHRPVALGNRDKPVFISPGQNALTYYITPERTSGPLKAGAYQANIDFKLSYD